MSINRKFRHDDIVKYVSDKYGDAIWNPLWGGEYGKIEGRVRGNATYESIDNCCITVLWENVESNTYAHDDLLLIENDWIDDKDFII